MDRSLPLRGRDDNHNRGDDNEDDEEDIDESGYKTVRDAILFAIEVSSSMLKRPDAETENGKKADSNSPLSAALRCAYHLMQQRIISNPKDLMGILLYGTEKTKFMGEDESSRGGWSFPNCYILTDLDVPEAEDVKTLKRLVEGSEEVEELFRPAKDPVSMHTVLFCANQIFQQKAPNFTSRRLFLITNNDDPHAMNKAFRSQATVRAKDLYDLGVVIELFPISTLEHTFDTELFFDDIVYRSSPSDPDAVSYNPAALTDIDKGQLTAGTTDGIGLLQSLLSTISSRAAPKRALFSSMPLELGPQLRISVKGYLLFKHQKPARSCYVYLGADKPQIAVGSSSYITSEGAADRVEKTEVRKAFTFGGEQIIFGQEELKKLRNFGDPIIRIIGFKPIDQLPMWANLKSSTYLHPSEEDYVGSTRVYSALYQKLAKDNLMALTWFIARRNAIPVTAAIIPTLSAADTDDQSNQARVSETGCPQGLHLIPLPFRDDIRDDPPSAHNEPLRAPDELVDAMRPIIQQLNLPRGIYDPARYPNPSLQWHYRILQALALEEDLPEKPEDKTKPKFKQIDKRVGNESTEWGLILNKVFKEHLMLHPDAAPTGSKRPTATSTAAKSKDTSRDATPSLDKKPRTDSSNGSITEEQMRRLLEKNNIGTLTVAQLKDFCSMKKLPVTGRKADLVDRIETWFEHK